MKDLLVQLDELPDEILMYIFKKLYNVEVLYSLIGVNQRLDRIVHDSTFTGHLRLLRHYPDRNVYRPLPDSILDRLCSEILPQIAHQVKTLCIESTSLKSILHATNYPNLCHLGIYGIDAEVARSLFIDENYLDHIQKNRISSFFIKFYNEECLIPKNDTYPFILSKILTIFSNLRCLKFDPSAFSVTNLYFNVAPSTVISSTLLELHISVHSISDCLYLLDGRFAQLRVLNVCLYEISSDVPTQHQEKLLPNLRFFSLYCDLETSAYNVSILPLLYRMVNLEKLDLELIVARSDEFIDSNTLKKDIIMHMSRLQKLTFYIYSIIRYSDENNFPPNEHMPKTSEYLFDNQIISYVDHFREKQYSQCYLYSYPYRLKVYNNVTNNFPGGLFTSVTEVSLYDERPFEYEFFVQIAYSFPLIKKLYVKNWKAQNNKQSIKSNNDNLSLSIANYVNLRMLHLAESHDDYVEMFLFDANVFCARNFHLCVNYQSLERVTYGFTRTRTGSNLENLYSLALSPTAQVDERIEDYIPHTSIYRL